jgi:hypothetical protein
LLHVGEGGRADGGRDVDSASGGVGDGDDGAAGLASAVCDGLVAAVRSTAVRKGGDGVGTARRLGSGRAGGPGTVVGGSCELRVDELGGLGRVDIEVVQVSLDILSCAADGIRGMAVVPPDTGKGGSVGELLAVAGEETPVGGAVEIVVRLVGGVADVTKGDNGSNSLASRGVEGQVRSSLSRAALEEGTASAAEDIAHDVGTVGIATDNEFGVGAALVIGDDLA